MPNNGGYMIAAYVVAAVILVGYTAVLWRTAKGERRREKGEGRP